VVKHWHRLPREAVAAPFLAVFKARLDGALSNLVWWKVSLLTSGRLKLGDLQPPFQPLPLYDSQDGFQTEEHPVLPTLQPSINAPASFPPTATAAPAHRHRLPKPGRAG